MGLALIVLLKRYLHCATTSANSILMEKVFCTQLASSAVGIDREVNLRTSDRVGRSVIVIARLKDLILKGVSRQWTPLCQVGGGAALIIIQLCIYVLIIIYKENT